LKITHYIIGTTLFHEELSMQISLSVIVALLLSFPAWAQPEDPDEEVVHATSCSLSVKTSVYNPDPGDATGTASVEAFLCDKGGVPIPYQPIVMTSTNGMFSCIPPNAVTGSVSADRSCFVTGSDGRILVYLVDIPFNKPGRIQASCTYGSFVVKASGSYSLTRNVITKKNNRSRGARNQ
jgi:hypothetical protein